MHSILSDSFFHRWPHLYLVLSFSLLLNWAHTAPTFQPVHAFEISPSKPASALIKGSDGNFYGTTTEGGANLDGYGRGYGTVFRLKPDGTLTTLVNFDFANGRNPRAALVQGSDGNFYGTTENGGSHDLGTVFKMTASGTLTTLVNFTWENGRNPISSLVQGRDGSFYGTTGGGGVAHGGVFKVTTTGVLTNLVIFTNTNGSSPSSALTLGSDGNFYGTTARGGNSDFGTLFRMSPSGTLTTLVHLNGTNGAAPLAALVQGNDGNFYGTTSGGGSFGFDDRVSNNFGTVFRMTPGGRLTTLVNFDLKNGSSPRAALVQGIDGNFYGTTTFGGGELGNGHGTVFKMTPGGTLTTIVHFDSANGAVPIAGLLDGGDGSYYGTTMEGGSSLRYGTVFKMTSSGALTTLVNFKHATASYPNTLLQGRDGNLYGTTLHGGGIYSDSNGISYGTAFKLSLGGKLNTIADFSATNGGYPAGGLVEDDDGNFFGITTTGGSLSRGTVFKMTSAGVVSTHAEFTETNGRNPHSRLVRGKDGNFYGTTSGGGSHDYGTVFKVTPTGILTTMVNFTITNGYYPNELMLGADGNLYGTTIGGGRNGSGTAFMLTPAGVFTTLVNFTVLNGYNNSPNSALVQGRDGSFYGRTSGGGSGVGDSITGTAFRMTPQGMLTTLVNFRRPYSSSPVAFVEGDDGNFYGTSKDGGLYGFGYVFKMTPTGELTTIMDFTGENGSYPAAALIRGIDGHLYGTTHSGGRTDAGRPAGGGQIYRLRMGPTVLTHTQTNVTNSSVTLNGKVNPGGYATTVSFRYGKDPTLAIYSTASAGTLPNGSTDTPVQANISDLEAGSVYYFRVVASNAENTVPQAGSIMSFTTSGSLGVYSTWAATSFSSPQLLTPLISGPGADPDGDGVVNFLECAFNLNPLISSDSILIRATGTSGLPLIRRTESPRTLSIQYIRRKTSSAARLNYTPQFSSSLDEWADFTGTETVQTIDDMWERVTVKISGSMQQNLFGRVKVSYGE